MPIHLDDIDRAILAVLQADAALPNAQVAERVGLSPSPCWRRIRRLESVGVIRGRVALVDRSLLGLEVTVFVSVRLSTHGRQSLPTFEAAVLGFPQVLSAWAMSGDIDYLLHVVARDIAAYEHFLRESLLQLEEVREIHSQICLSELKYTTALPVDVPGVD